MTHVVTAPAELIALHVGALYRTDSQARLIESNEEHPSPAPRVFVGRTEVGVVCYTQRELDPALAAELSQLAADLPPLPEGLGELALYEPLRTAVEADAPIERLWHGLAYHFAEPPREPHPDVVEIDEDRSALVGLFADFQTELDQMRPFYGIVRDGAVVSGCYSARLSDDAAEAGVDTVEEHRGQGYAAAVVNAWRGAVERSGRTPLYSTSYDNVSSQAVGRRLGLRQYAETLSLT